MGQLVRRLYAQLPLPGAVAERDAERKRDAEGRLTLGFTRIADPALTYTVQGSVDLVEWTPVASFTSATLPAGPQLVTDTALPGDGPRRFLRLSVTR